MATQIQIVNKVLKRLREDSVGASTDNAYAGLIAEFVADIHDEVQRAKAWKACKNKVTTQILVDQKRYNLSKLVGDGGDITSFENQLCTTQSNLLFDTCGLPLAYYYKDSQPTIGYPLALVNENDRIRQDNVISRDQTIQPYWFSLGQDAENLYLDITYKPLIIGPTDRFLLYCYTPDPQLESDGSTDDVVFRVPDRPVYLGALMMALNERGEEMGEPGNIAETRYMDALGAAIEMDQKHEERTNAFDWYRG